MKVMACNGSARKDGNTAILINTVLNELRSCKIDTELVQLADKISGDVLRVINVLNGKIKSVLSLQMQSTNILIK